MGHKERRRAGGHRDGGGKREKKIAVIKRDEAGEGTWDGKGQDKRISRREVKASSALICLDTNLFSRPKEPAAPRRAAPDDAAVSCARPAGYLSHFVMSRGGVPRGDDDDEEEEEKENASSLATEERRRGGI